MALFDLNRAGDTPIATLMLASIVPKDWPTFPPRTAPNTPIYVPVVSYNGGAVGDDVDQATSNATDAYTPRTQTDKATATGNTLAVDVARSRGTIAAYQRYPVAADTPLAAPTITSLAPATAVAGAPSISVIITGTGYTQWSTVTSGGVPIPVKYLSPTQLQIIQNALYSVPGTVQVVVTDHNVRTAPSNFVFT